MPRLRNLVIGVHDPDDEDEVEFPSWTDSSQSVSLIASELRAISLVVTFDAEGGAMPEIDGLCLRWLEVALPDLLRNCIVYNGLLESISYSGTGTGDRSAFPIQLLREFARNVFLDDIRVLDAENQSDPAVAT
ncbi:hypothetical protein EXIGLDRAFT_770786 [Exidia glandulosa HHB12029]|uniref:Uncharacterized protein n=1 Tax=Exidia glandulosa HHB12029 TaxID=1314781 RepID=A0A165GFW0_EXIGL|nr:hypothetical protein EXIGLDRAFT_770786 [Exidia glandulosa HHB12029]